MEQKVAVIGHGYWGKNLARNMARLRVLHAICDTDNRAVKEISFLYPGVIATNEYSRVLADSNVNGVVIATPSSLHYSMAKQALLAGKDVMVEKPFTLNTREAEELVAISRERERIVLVGHLMLYHPAVQLLKEYIQEGELGEIYYLYSTRVNLGQVRDDEDVLWRLAPHDISILIYLLGGVPSVVSAQGLSYLRPGFPDVVFALLRFNKAIAHIQVSWLDPHKVRQLTVVGSRKMAVFDDTEPEHKLKIYDKGIDKCDLSTRSGNILCPQMDNDTEILAAECADFVGCINSRRQPLSTARQGLEVVWVLEAVSEVIRKVK